MCSSPGNDGGSAVRVPHVLAYLDRIWRHYQRFCENPSRQLVCFVNLSIVVFADGTDTIWDAQISKRCDECGQVLAFSASRMENCFALD